MRREIIATTSYATARKACPWAAIIACIVGGFFAFESMAEYQTWKGQR